MSGNSGPVASAKGDTTSSKSSKSGFDHLDINTLFKVSKLFTKSLLRGRKT